MMTRLHRLVSVWMLVSLLAAGTALAAPVLEATSPQEAELLVAEGVAGRLAPGASAWYEYRPGGSVTGRADAVTLFFVPATELGAQASGVNFAIYSAGQVMSGGDITTMSPVGTGSGVSRDGDPNTGEYLWQGLLPGSDPYYVRVQNATPLEIGFWLYPGDADHVESVATPATAVEPPAAGVSDDTPLDLPWPDPASGHLEPEQVAWYRWVLSGDAAQPMSSSFTLFFTPGDSLFADRVLCEVMTVAQRDARLSGQGTANTGAGTIVSRDGDPLTGERFWSGHLVAGEVYIVRIANASDVPIDYWLFPGDIIHPVFPPPVEPAATPEPTMTFTPAAPLPTSTPTAQPATATPAAAVTRAATATATPLSPAKTPTPTPTPVLPSDLVPSSEQSKATDWEDWHVALTCVTHCDQN